METHPEKLKDVLASLEAVELTDEQQAMLEGIVGGSGSNGAFSNCDTTTNNCSGGNCGNCVSGCT